MSSRRITSCLGAIALLSAAVLGAGSAEAKFIPGLGEVSDCVPGATNCKTGPKPQPQPMSQSDAGRRCRPLLTSVTPRREAVRVYNNCLALQTNKGFTLCPGGRRQPVGFNGNRC